MIPVFSLDAERRALREAVATWCAEAPVGAPFDSGRWRGLAELGGLSVGTDGDSRVLDLVAVFEALGENAFAGPLVETVIGMGCSSAALFDRDTVAAGRGWVSVGRSPLWPFGDGALAHFAVSGRDVDHLRVARLDAEPVALDTLAGDPWCRADAELGAEVEGGPRAIALGRVAAAALLVGGGQTLVRDAAERARTRRQFGQPIGIHQAVSHPLADCLIRLDASKALMRQAAWRLDAEDGDRFAHAEDAFRSARRSALSAAYQAHQTFGAFGVALEGPVFAVSRRVRQWASLPLSGADR